MTPAPIRLRPRSIATLSAVVAVGAVLLTGCGSKANDTSASATSPSASGKATDVPTSSTPPSTGAQVVGPNEVVIKDYDFVPTTVTVKAGTTVTWTDTDTADHWVVSAPASPEAFDLGRQRTGGAVTHTFSKPGTYPYFCNLHNYMKGTVVVS